MKDIERLAGAPYWAQIEALHKVYGDVLGITKGKESVPAATKLLDPLARRATLDRELSREIRDQT